MITQPRISDVRRRVLGDDERLVDFAPVRADGLDGPEAALYLFLTDRRLVAVWAARLEPAADEAVASVERADLAFVMLRGDTLRLLMGETPLTCRFPSPEVATAFRRGLTA